MKKMLCCVSNNEHYHFFIMDCNDPRDFGTMMGKHGPVTVLFDNYTLEECLSEIARMIGGYHMNRKIKEFGVTIE